MSPEAQRVAIARACRWTAIGLGSVSWDGEKTDWHGDGPNGYTELPDYLTDLNAMHEAEKLLPKPRTKFAVVPRYVYENHLLRLTGGEALFATAAQRAEAFLRTTGKWEGGK